NQIRQGKWLPFRRSRAPNRERLRTDRGKPYRELGALSGHQRLIRRRGVTPLMYQHGDTVIVERERMVRACSQADPLAQKNRIAAARGKYVYAKHPISYMAALWPRKLKLRTFHAGAILAFFTSYLLPSVQSVFFRTSGNLRRLRRDGSVTGYTNSLRKLMT